MSVHWLLVVEERESSAKTETNRPTQEKLLRNQKRSEQNAKAESTEATHLLMITVQMFNDNNDDDMMVTQER